ncbi:MAG: Cycloartenol synthase-like protein [Chthoniobacteraceae bacterium]|nr:Cycloartenol synthase-like protein [Chthoniobacteraceae bacterium]
MKLPFLILIATALAGSPLFAEEPIARKAENVSFRNEIQLAIDKGLTWLKENQKPDGYWSTDEHPALTSLPLLAFHREPTGKYRDGKAPFLQKGYDFIRAKAQPDGGIYGKGLSNYNTSLALVALLTTRDPKDEPLITKAREFIIAQQATGMASESLDGGIGYGPTGVSPKRQHPDLDNTLISIEALQAYRASRPEVEAKHDLNWQAAIDFISRTQNLPSHNPKGSADPADKGGFIYYPGFSNADPAEGPKALRSYGTMTYAGLLSFIYADLKKDDPRVVAALEWLTKNFTLEENPGMGRAGLYYYYHLMSKGLVAAGVDKLQLADGKKVEWAPVLAGKLIQLQQGDGSWVNDTARWMEKDPVLVTCYCVLTLELIYNRL